MGIKIPPAIAQEVKDYIYQLADKHGYLRATRPANGQFLDSLSEDPKAGGVIGAFTKKENIRVYIKDAVLNRYAKDKHITAIPNNLESLIKKKLSSTVHFIERDGQGVSLYKAESGCKYSHVVYVDGTFLKWESALGKAIKYAAGKPFGSDQANSIYFFLTLFAGNTMIPKSDQKLIELALGYCSANCVIYGER